MTIYTTPLQFGYFFSLLMWVLFLVRGFQENRLSDKLLGWIMFILAMELQDYTFGFAGINVLWNELNGFPRGVSLLFGPVVYFYFRAQVNRSFQLKKEHAWHLLPYVLYFLYEISGFVQGPEVVQKRYESDLHLVLNYVYLVGLWASFIYYLSKCLSIYKNYRTWSLNQFSNTELISFKWFRNFIYAMIFWLIFREVMNILDALLSLDFYQDWWWNLALVSVSIYIGMLGYSQKQPLKIHFDINMEHDANGVLNEEKESDVSTTSTNISNEERDIADRLSALMKRDRLYLQSDLNLQELALHVNVNHIQLSGAINKVFKQNFNDYINDLRIDEFEKQYHEDVTHKFTILSLAFEAGFNSKATFNRAFKKAKGCSPKEYFAGKRDA